MPDFILQSPLSTTFANKVPVQLGVMSRCPDALLCETTFNRVLERVQDKVDLSLVYVGRYIFDSICPKCSRADYLFSYRRIDSTQPDFGVWCMHGPEECAGNVQQLCVHKHTPFKKWWEFVQCQNYEGRYKVGEPDVAFKCAKVAGIDWEHSGAGECAGFDASGKAEEGITLLQESVILGKKLGIK